MKDSDFGLLAKETILNCFSFLDIESFFQVNKTCTTMQEIGQERSLWLNLCHLEPRAKALIAAANLENELQHGVIDPLLFLTGVLNSKIMELKSLLFPQNNRIFSLWTPCYLLNKPSFFPQKSAGNQRYLYLTEELAMTATLNANKVKHWLKTNISINAIDFEQLFLNNKLFYSKQISFAYPEKSDLEQNSTDYLGFVRK